MNNIMDMPNGTKIRHKKTGAIYILQDYVNSVARIIYSANYITMSDYINANVQDDYEVVE